MLLRESKDISMASMYFAFKSIFSSLNYSTILINMDTNSCVECNTSYKNHKILEILLVQILHFTEVKPEVQEFKLPDQQHQCVSDKTRTKPDV